MVIGDDDEVYYPKEEAKNTHYLPMTLNVENGNTVTYIDLGGNLRRVEAKGDQIDLLLTATKKENFTIDLYATMEDAKSKTDGHVYTVDLTDCDLSNGSKPTINLHADIPTDVIVGNYSLDTGFTGTVSQSGDSFVVSGVFTKQDNANEDLKFDPKDAKGYYFAIELLGTKGTAVKLLSNGKINIFGETNDNPDGTNMILVLTVDPANPVLTFKEYANRTNAESDIDGKEFTIDCSNCSFN